MLSSQLLRVSLLVTVQAGNIQFGANGVTLPARPQQSDLQAILADLALNMPSHIKDTDAGCAHGMVPITNLFSSTYGIPAVLAGLMLEEVSFQRRPPDVTQSADGKIETVGFQCRTYIGGEVDRSKLTWTQVALNSFYQRLSPPLNSLGSLYITFYMHCHYPERLVFVWRTRRDQVRDQVGLCWGTRAIARLSETGADSVEMPDFTAEGSWSEAMNEATARRYLQISVQVWMSFPI